MSLLEDEILTRRAVPTAASSWNVDDRTLRATIAAGASVERRDPRGAFLEVLDPAGMILDGQSVPVLNSHRRGDLRDVLGSTISIETVGGKVEATLRLSRRPDIDPIVQDIVDGHLKGVSIGYRVLHWREDKDPTTGVRRMTATRWELLEVSLVPLPADRLATLRGTAMTDTTAPAATPTINMPAAVDRAAVNAEIRSVARVAGLDQSWIDIQVDGNVTIDAARSAAFAEMQTRSAPAAQVRTAHNATTIDNPAVRCEAMGEALFVRIDAGHKPSDLARQFIGLSTVEMGRMILREHGVATTGLSADGVVTRALHTTSDFALILGDTVGRTLRQSYAAAPSAMKLLARQSTVPDFRKRSRLLLDNAGLTLEKVNEKGEFKSGTLEESGESYKIDTFGRIIGITRQAIVNDDLGAFSDLSRRLGQAAAAFEAQFLVTILESNPVMSDGNAVFHAGHKNLVATGLLQHPRIDTLSAARLAMRKQTGLGSNLINVTPKYVLAPPELETVAEALLTTIAAATTADVNPFASLTLVVEPRLTDPNRWYVVADPATIDGLEYSYLSGSEGPQTESRNGFEVDGVQTKVRLDFGAGWIDHRGWYRNDGEA